MNMTQIVPLLGLIGLIGLAGLAGIRNPVAKTQPGAVVRLLGIAGFAGLTGFWIPGAGAAGALGLWNHQDARLARWGTAGWLGLVGVPFLVMHYL